MKICGETRNLATIEKKIENFTLKPKYGMLLLATYVKSS